jgi:HAD superfamily hydrolase (TIGR01549 family)
MSGKINVKAMLFDMDGTLIDSRQAIYRQLKDFAETHFLPQPTYQQVMEHVHQTNLKGLLYKLWPAQFKDSRFAENIAKEIETSYTNFYMPRYGKVIDGAIEFLITLKKSEHRIGIVTNASQLMMNQFLKGFNLNNIVNIAISADDIKKPKPNSEGILKALSSINVEASEALFIGDSTSDIIAGKTAGLLTVGVLSGIATRKELKTAGADYITTSVSCLRSII